MDLLVIFVDVGALFSVDLDTDEIFIKLFSQSLVLKDLMLHNVTPVARAVSYGDEYRFVLSLCALKGFVAPRVPVYGIVFVLL